MPLDGCVFCLAAHDYVSQEGIPARQGPRGDIPRRTIQSTDVRDWKARMPMLSIRRSAPLVVAFAALVVASPAFGLVPSHRIAAPVGVLLGDSATEVQSASLHAGLLR